MWRSFAGVGGGPQNTSRSSWGSSESSKGLINPAVRTALATCAGPCGGCPREQPELGRTDRERCCSDRRVRCSLVLTGEHDLHV